MRWNRLLGVLVVAGLAVVLPSCGKKEGGGSRIKVAFVSNNADPFWNIAEAGTKKAADELGVEVIFRKPPTGTAGEQKEIIEDLLTQGIKGIAISVNDPQGQIDLLNRIADRVPLVTQDNDAPASKRLCYIGTDNYEAGKAAGRLVKECMPQGGKIAIFVGKPDPVNARERRQGVLDELAGQKDAAGPKVGNYTLVDTYYDYNDQSKAKQNAADVLTLVRDEANVCLVGLWAYNPPTILSAVRDAGKEGKVHIVAFDEHEQTLNAIKSGSIHGSIVQDPFGFGYESVKLLKALAQGDKSGLPGNGIKYVPHRVVKKAPDAAKGEVEVEAFHRELRQRMGKE